MGTNFGLSQIKGFSETGLFPIYMTGPNGYLFNFADAGEFSQMGINPHLFWLSEKFDQPEAAQSEYKILTGHEARPEDFIWYFPETESDYESLPLDKLFRGPVSVASFRSDWKDPNSLFVAVKAGYNQVNHGHLDLGNFVLDALGVRWLCDLGKDNYNLPGYWARQKQDGQRWNYYRLNSKSHNVPMLNGKNQDVFAVTEIIKFNSTESQGFAIVDLTSAYQEFAVNVQRGIALTQNRTAVLVQDEFKLKGSCRIDWGLTTDAEILLQDNKAVLSKDGKKLIAEILSPENGQFIIESARQKPPEKTNKGVKRLIISLKDQQKDVRIAVLLQPVWPKDKVLEFKELIPLEKW